MKPKLSAVACALVVIGVMASGCDAIFPKKVKEEDCKKWVDHAFEVIKDDMSAAMKKCPADMKKMFEKAMEKGMDKEKDKTVSKCKKHVDEKYEGKDADCFMKASTFKDLKACKFKIASGGKDDDDDNDKDPIEAIKKACKGSGGDDDGDSKKKKGDDDDEDKGKKKKKGDDD